MIGNFFDAFFGCSHSHTSFPITARSGRHRSAAAAVTGTYVVCLDCGREFPYDWEEMRVVNGPAHVAAGIRETVQSYAEK